MHCFFLMMARHPEIQRKAQAEIEVVCGRDRLPTFTDRERLPYVEAIVKEVTRIHPSVPLGTSNLLLIRTQTIFDTGLPHTVTEDDEHDGYYIPKGSIVFANIWYALDVTAFMAVPLISSAFSGKWLMTARSILNHSLSIPNGLWDPMLNKIHTK